MQRLLCIVHGRVQGVGFRLTSARLARQFPLTGSVRNLRDRTVELIVQGEPAQIEKYLTAIGEEFPGHIDQLDREILPLVDGETGLVVLE
jgi:acylphosphatase